MLFLKEIRERIIKLFPSSKSEDRSSAENVPSSSFIHKMQHRVKSGKVDKKEDFSSVFEKLNSANFKTASALSGTLSVAPISVHNIMHPKLNPRSIFIRVSYGQDINIDSSSCQVSLGERSSYTICQNYLDSFSKMSIDMNMLNLQGCVRISVMASGVPVATEIYRIDIPVLNIFDCAYSAVNNTYDAFFPLLDNDEISLSSGDWGNYSSRVFSEEKAFEKDCFHKPFIHLMLKVSESHGLKISELHSEAHSFVEEKEEITKRWARVSVPCLSFSFVNSTKKLEVSY
jgi:hypothetical protein